MEKCPSIFNDVIGPVMRGPSSSHVAAAARMGRLAQMGAGGRVVKALVEYDQNGSLAETHDGQGSDMGLVCGLLSLELADPRVKDALKLAEEEGLSVQFRVLDYGAVHPNHYRISVTDATGQTHRWEGISTGGGMIEMQKLDGFALQLYGDCHELLALVDTQNAEETRRWLEQKLPNAHAICESVQSGQTLLNLKTTQPLCPALLEEANARSGVFWAFALRPVLPTLASPGGNLPFCTAAELLAYAQNSGREMWQLATLYESQRGGTGEEDVYQKMEALTAIMQNCVQVGLSGTHYEDRILGPQAHLIEEKQHEYPALCTGLLGVVIRNITAIMEVKSAMGLIVAAPTAGSCGCLPGTLTGAAEVLGGGATAITKALLAAGLIGVFIAGQATFAAEVAGCQAECGAGSAMAAAGLVQLLGGSPRQCVDAASLALQNVSGLVCDTVANRVEVPCLGKNIMGGSNAIASATMALAGYDAVIPLDETIQAMYDIGQKLPAELCCTLGGLGKTPTACAIRSRLG